MNLRGVPPDDQYVIPKRSHPDCGGKFCELRGCAIIGECQARQIGADRFWGRVLFMVCFAYVAVIAFFVFLCWSAVR